MIKLVLFRILPAFAAVGIVGAAVSPVRGTIEAFGAAADALAGDTDVATPGGITVDQSQLPSALTGIQKPRTTSGKKQKLQELARKYDQAQKKTDPDDYGWEAGDRAMKPLERPKR